MSPLAAFNIDLRPGGEFETYTLDEQDFKTGEQVDQAATPLTFEGYPRSGRRGVGTRNFIVVLATTSHSTAFAEALEKRLTASAQRGPQHCTGEEQPTHPSSIHRALHTAPWPPRRSAPVSRGGAPLPGSITNCASSRVRQHRA